MLFLRVWAFAHISLNVLFSSLVASQLLAFSLILLKSVLYTKARIISLKPCLSLSLTPPDPLYCIQNIHNLNFLPWLLTRAQCNLNLPPALPSSLIFLSSLPSLQTPATQTCCLFFQHAGSSLSEDLCPCCFLHHHPVLLPPPNLTSAHSSLYPLGFSVNVISDDRPSLITCLSTSPIL